MKINKPADITKSLKIFIGCEEIGSDRCKQEVHEKNLQNAGHHVMVFVIENADWGKVISKYHIFHSEKFAGHIKPFGHSEKPRTALVFAKKAHIKSRTPFELPNKPPRDLQGMRCNICVNECRIPSNSVGCRGIRKNEQGKITGVSSERGKASWYHDPLPTNCVPA